MLRALGADSRWVTGVVHWQASLFTIAAVALGAPFGIVAGRIAYRTFVDRVGAVDTVTLPLATFALALAALVALANVVAVPSARRPAGRRPRASSPASAALPVGRRGGLPWAGGAPLAKRPARSVSSTSDPSYVRFDRSTTPDKDGQT